MDIIRNVIRVPIRATLKDPNYGFDGIALGKSNALKVLENFSPEYMLQ